MKKDIYLFSISSHPDAIHINPLKITFLKPKIDFSKYDYLIITSKQASQALMQYEKEKYISKKALCISKQSAVSFEELGAEVLEIGDGYGDDLLQNIQNYPKDTKWLYLRAKDVASDFYEICKKNGFNIDDEIVYQSSCNDDMKNLSISDDAILIFTSPSAIKCFLKYQNIPKASRVVVIGKTSAKALPEGVDAIISKEKTIQSCFDAIV